MFRGGVYLDVKILVAAHKKYQMPQDSIYLPIHCGKWGREDLGYQGDDTGDNISEYNPSFCELTAVYWAWKNLQADYIGLVHYRRYFAGKRRCKDPFDRILTYSELQPLLERYPVIVPQKRHYVIETLYSHYAHTLYVEPLDKAGEIIRKKYPEYMASFDQIMNQRWGYMFNMMIMRRDLLDRYCQWLFDILFDLKDQVDTTGYSSYQKRFCGRVSELLFNVWLDYQVRSHLLEREEIKELPWVMLEKTHLWRRGTAFLKAKFFHKRYESSF